MPDPSTTPRPWPELLDDKTLAEMLSISARQCWKLSAIGTLPKPRPIPGSRSQRWHLAEVREAVKHWK